MTDFHQILLDNTLLRPPKLCPEIRLHLLRPGAALWTDWVPDDPRPFPYWGLAWGAGQAMARWLLDNPDVISGLRAADLGCGSGIASIAASLSGARSVLAIDNSTDAINATRENALANGVTSVHPQLHEIDDLDVTEFDVLLVADLEYALPDLTERLRINCRPEQTILIAQADRRGPALPNVSLLASYEIRADPETEAFFVRQASVYELKPGLDIRPHALQNQ